MLSQDNYFELVANDRTQNCVGFTYATCLSEAEGPSLWGRAAGDCNVLGQDSAFQSLKVLSETSVQNFKI